MIRHLIASIITLLFFSAIYSQTKPVICDCPKTQSFGTKSDTAFYFSNGKTIVLCGFINKSSTPEIFSEFVLAVCGQDTIIESCGAELTYIIKKNKDTLLLQEIVALPDRNFKFQLMIWTNEYIYFSDQKIVKKLYVNRQILKYSQEEISRVLKTFESAKPGLDESKMELAYRLFMATISDNKKARLYFKEFKTKFGTLDGAFSEQYSELTAMLEQWDQKE